MASDEGKEEQTPGPQEWGTRENKVNHLPRRTGALREITLYLLCHPNI